MVQNIEKELLKISEVVNKKQFVRDCCQLKITCQHVDFLRKEYPLRCLLAIVTFGGGAAS